MLAEAQKAVFHAGLSAESLKDHGQKPMAKPHFPRESWKSQGKEGLEVYLVFWQPGEVKAIPRSLAVTPACLIPCGVGALPARLPICYRNLMIKFKVVGNVKTMGQECHGVTHPPLTSHGTHCAA